MSSETPASIQVGSSYRSFKPRNTPGRDSRAPIDSAPGRTPGGASPSSSTTGPEADRPGSTGDDSAGRRVQPIQESRTAWEQIAEAASRLPKVAG